MVFPGPRLGTALADPLALGFALPLPRDIKSDLPDGRIS